MVSEVRYRPIAPQDGPALGALIGGVPDAGSIGFTYEYLSDPIAIYRSSADRFLGAVAVVGDRVIGCILGEVGPVQWAGQVQMGVYLSNLRVHPDYRRQGVASGLAEWGMSILEQQVGSNLLLYSAVQEGNVGEALLRRHGFHPTEAIEGGVLPMRRRPPRPRAGVEVRPAKRGELTAMAGGMNAFYADHNLWSPVTATWLGGYLEQQVDGVRPNQLYVAVRDGEVVAGMSLSHRTALVRMRVARAPWTVRLLGGWLGILGQDGVIRALTVRRAWFVEGAQGAARALWQTLRWDLRAQGNCMGVAYDPRGPLRQVYQVPFWLPVVKARYWVRGEGPLEPGRLTYCVAGA